MKSIVFEILSSLGNGNDQKRYPARKEEGPGELKWLRALPNDPHTIKVYI